MLSAASRREGPSPVDSDEFDGPDCENRRESRLRCIVFRRSRTSTRSFLSHPRPRPRETNKRPRCTQCSTVSDLPGGKFTPIDTSDAAIPHAVLARRTTEESAAIRSTRLGGLQLANETGSWPRISGLTTVVPRPGRDRAGSLPARRSTSDRQAPRVRRGARRAEYRLEAPDALFDSIE